MNGPYDDIFVFDNYAVVLKDKKDINAIYLSNFRGDIVPLNFEIPLYNDLTFTDGTFDAITFWDYTGKGDYSMIGAIRTPGAITLYVFDLAINYEN